jgi:hypothetical protein
MLFLFQHQAGFKVSPQGELVWVRDLHHLVNEICPTSTFPRIATNSTITRHSKDGWGRSEDIPQLFEEITDFVTLVRSYSQRLSSLAKFPELDNHSSQLPRNQITRIELKVINQIFQIGIS